MEQLMTQTKTLTGTDIEKLFQTQADRHERRDIVRQLLSQAARNPGAGSEARAPETKVSYEKSIQRALAGTQQVYDRVLGERREAGRLWGVLEAHPPARRRVMIRNDRRFQTWGLLECLQERYRALLEEDVETALEAAELAWVIAQSLDHRAYGEERVHDFQASALVNLGNVRRAIGDLMGARSALDQAGAVLALGTGDPLEKAELEAARGALLRDLGRVDEAGDALRRAGHLTKRVGGTRDRKAAATVEVGQEPLHHRLHAAIPGFRPRRR